MRKTLLLITFVVSLLSVVAQHPASGAGSAYPGVGRPKVGVALAGGGAKGAAHIGVLKYLEEIGIPIDYITGTSMGSIIGGLYSLGYTPDELAYLIADIDWDVLMSNNVSRQYQSSLQRERGSRFMLTVPFGVDSAALDFSQIVSSLPGGVINGNSVVNLLNRLSVGYNDSVDFDSLPIPFACVATDILTGDSVILRKGNLSQAIRSSMAIPGVFTPVHHGNHLLSDGGLVNNFPVDVCLRLGADLVIGVELADEMITDVRDLRSLPAQLSQYLSIAVSNNRNANLELCDVYLHPDMTSYNVLSFSHDAIDTLVRRGYECAKMHHDELMTFKKQLERYGSCQKLLQAPRAKYLTEQDTFVLANIVYTGVGEHEKSWLKHKCGLETGVPTTISDIEAAVNILNGSGFFSDVTYNIFPTEEEYWLNHMVYSDALGLESYRLEIALSPAVPHQVSMSFRFDSEESASLLFRLGFNENRLGGHKAMVEADLNYNFRLAANYAYCGLGIGDINLGYRYHNSTFNSRQFDATSPVSRVINHHNLSLYVSEFHLRDFRFALGLDQDIYSNQSAITLDELLYNGFFNFGHTTNTLGVFLRGRYDNLDDSYFATKGTRANFNVGWRKENKYFFNTQVDSGFVNAALSWQTYFTPFARFSIIPQFSTRLVIGKNPAWYNNVVGGALPGRYLDHQIPFVGMVNIAYVDDLAAVLRLDLRYQLIDKLYLSAMANYLFSMDEYNVEDYHQIFGCGLRFAYKSAIGPLSLDFQWNTFTRRVGLYLNLGYQF